ncbi:BRO family protein [Sutterella wadsworthensis]
MQALSFSFENMAVRTLGTPEHPLFVALDVCSALGYAKARNAVAQHVDPEDLIKSDIDTNGGRQTINCVNESGLYALIFGSKLESAKRFKRWVTSEVLPAIRRNGQYNAACPATITPAEQLQIQQAVARRAKTSSANYQTIYRAIKVRFQIPRYNELPRCQFAECLKFIDAVDLKVPEAKTAAAPVCENPFTPEELAASPEKPPKGYTYQVSAKFLADQRTFVYYWRYLFRRELELFEEFLYRTESPRAARFHEAVNNLDLIRTENQLRRLGFPMDELPCYQHYVRRLATAH